MPEIKDPFDGRAGTGAQVENPLRGIRIGKKARQTRVIFRQTQGLIPVAHNSF